MVGAATLLGLAAALPSAAVSAPVGLVASYGFEEPAGTMVRDASGAARNASARSVVRVSDGRFGKAARFDGRRSQIVVPAVRAPRLSSAFTLQAWVKLIEPGGWRPVVTASGPGRIAWGLYANNPQGGPVVAAALSQGARRTSGLTTPASAGWVHLTATYDGSRLRLYRDGALVSVRRASGRLPAQAGVLRIGVAGRYRFRGLIDEIRIYRRALSESEIRGQMDRPVGAAPAPSPGSPSTPPATGGGGSSPQPAPGGGGSGGPTVMQFGVVSTRDTDAIDSVRKKAGAGLTRIAFKITATPAEIRPFVARAAQNRVRPILLAEFPGFAPPTPEQARALAAWAREFGPGGTFWQGRSDGAYAPRYIEFGNETGYSYQGMDDRGGEYALRVKDAYEAIRAANPRVGLLVQADDPSISTAKWVNAMFDAVPNIDDMAAMWTVHPYGPRSRWEPRLRSLVTQTAARGASSSIPIAITEWGLATDNGRPLSDNYEWPVDMTYAEAGDALTRTLQEMNARFPNRIALFTYYYAFDHEPHGASSNREDYFGAFTNTYADKGALSDAIRAAAARYPGGG